MRATTRGTLAWKKLLDGVTMKGVLPIDAVWHGSYASSQHAQYLGGYNYRANNNLNHHQIS